MEKNWAGDNDDYVSYSYFFLKKSVITHPHACKDKKKNRDLDSTRA